MQMTTYSVAEAKNRLRSPIDKALEGEEVVITRHGKPVAELRPRRQTDVTAARAMTEWLISRRQKDVGITSVELLDRIYEEDNQR
jgi:prevent-host-death family protein